MVSSIDLMERFRSYVKEIGLKRTSQREIIADVLFQQKVHMTAEQILIEVRKVQSHMSLATVYRTIKLLVESGLIRSHDFGHGHMKFEPNLDNEDHHDHLVCTQCGHIVEFFESKIEDLQEDIAKKYGFKLTTHKMELYGHCKKCQKKTRP